MLSRVETYKKQKRKNRFNMTSKIVSIYATGVLGISVAANVGKPVQEVRATSGTKKQTKEQFIQEVSEFATQVAGENDLYASVMVAQSLLESNWGRSGLANSPNYNLFGIKGSYEGQSVQMRTKEDNGSGEQYEITASFRKYPSYRESLEDYVDLITGGNNTSSWRYEYYKGARKSEANTYQEATAHLTGRYATDVNYADKLNKIIEDYQLYKLDTGAVTTSSGEVYELVRETVTVKKGDNLYRIAKDNNVELEEVYQMNPGTRGEYIYPGQEIVVKEEQVLVEKEEVEEVEEEQVVETTKTVTVKKGDYLFKIARDNGVSAQTIYDLNPDKVGQIIYPGDTVIISK